MRSAQHANIHLPRRDGQRGITTEPLRASPVTKLATYVEKAMPLANTTLTGPVNVSKDYSSLQWIDLASFPLDDALDNLREPTAAIRKRERFQYWDQCFAERKALFQRGDRILGLYFWDWMGVQAAGLGLYYFKFPYHQGRSRKSKGVEAEYEW